jgi:hypothetical protein
MSEETRGDCVENIGIDELIILKLGNYGLDKFVSLYYIKAVNLYATALLPTSQKEL